MQKKIILLLAIAAITFTSTVYSRDLESVKLNFLKEDYKSAIAEGEKILAGSKDFQGCDKLYYLMGLSYLKTGNYLRASDIFEIIIKEFPDTRLKEEARLSLGDTYFYMGDYAKAKSYYLRLLENSPHARLRPALYYRLSQIDLKGGDTLSAKEYLAKIKQEYPLSPEIRINSGLFSSVEIYYTVQVGSFSSSLNATNLMRKLIQQGYLAYVEELKAEDSRAAYRVRIGKFSLRQQALDLESKLAQEGYPTKIFP
ncbi:MAG: tetratricopeptide repeat protein [Candidatus Omnitrophica bacterium]|nr:tetratricopeptide repeat protein [Candidatus Omnitrophota bacterium]